MNRTSRLLIFSPNWLGDAVMSLPALREARRIFEGWEISVACRPALADLFDCCPFVDRVFALQQRSKPDRAHSVSALRNQRYEATIVLQNSFRSAWRAWRARSPMRIGYRGDGRAWLLTHAVKRPSKHTRRHQVFDYLDLMAAIELQLNGQSRVDFDRPDMSLQVDPHRREHARRLLGQFGLPAEAPFVILNPGAINSRAKQWLPDRFAAVSDRLHREVGAVGVVIGTEQERAITNRVLYHARQPLIDLTGKTGLGELMGVLSLAALLITNDTGPSHLGAALGLPIVALFGPTEDFATRPFSINAQVVMKPVACAPCMLRDCPIDHRCMTGISVDEVLEAARGILGVARHCATS